MDKGPWKIFLNQDDIIIESDDFTHDVQMKITGDFATPTQHLKYAEWIADILNNHCKPEEQ